jgi:hypothetical protein
MPVSRIRARGLKFDVGFEYLPRQLTVPDPSESPGSFTNIPMKNMKSEDKTIMHLKKLRLDGII